MNRIAAFLLAVLALVPAPLAAQTIAYETVETLADGTVIMQTIEETVVYVDENGNEVAAPEDEVLDEGGTWRFAPSHPVATTSAPVPAGVASFGPFRVLDDGTAAMVDISDARTPAQFAAMLRAYPGIRMLKLVDVPGTEDDVANLRLGRMIRAHGIATHVPKGGSVRSGGVELFLAGTTHTAESGSEFAVHSWEDEDGRGPQDYAMSAPENAKYLGYYREMGMTDAEARAFYAMTNAAPFERPRYLGAAQMGQWVHLR